MARKSGCFVLSNGLSEAKLEGEKGRVGATSKFSSLVVLDLVGNVTFYDSRGS
jgi:hypothetical protein